MKKFRWEWFWTWICLAFLVLILWILPNTLWAATYSYPIVVSTVDIDSVRYSYFSPNDSIGTGVFSSFPDGDTITLDEDNLYKIRYKYWFTGETTPISYDEVVAQITASVGVIAGGWIDSNKAEQGGIAGADITLGVYLVDTSGTDTYLSGVGLTLQDAGGVQRGIDETDANGYGEFTVTSGGWRILSQAPWYVIPTYTCTVTTNDTVNVQGYDFAPTAPGSVDKCTVYGYEKDNLGNAVQYATVTITMAENAYDTCSNQGIIRKTMTTKTTALGVWNLPLIKSKCLSNQNYYDITIEKDGIEKTTSFLVPDSTLYKLVF